MPGSEESNYTFSYSLYFFFLSILWRIEFFRSSVFRYLGVGVLEANNSTMEACPVADSSHTHTHIWTQIIQSYTSPFVHTTPIMCKFIIMFTFLCESYISKSLVKTALPIYLNNPSQMFWKTVVLLCYMRCWRLGIYIYLRVEQRTEEHMGNGWYCRETVGKLMIVFPLCSQEKQYRGWRCLVKLYKVSLNQFKYTTSYICI